MNRAFLEGLGLEKDTIEKIMKEHGQSVESQKAKVTELTDEITSLKGVISEKERKIKDYEEKDLTELDKVKKLLEDKEKSLATLKDEFQSLKVNAEKEKIKFAFKSAAEKAGIAYVDDAMRLTDLDSLKLSEDGSVEGLEQLVTKLAEEKPFLLSSNPQLGNPSNPGGNGERLITRDQFLKMNYRERTALYEKNPELYKQLNSNT